MDIITSTNAGYSLYNTAYSSDGGDGSYYESTDGFTVLWWNTDAANGPVNSWLLTPLNQKSVAYYAAGTLLGGPCGLAYSIGAAGTTPAPTLSGGNPRVEQGGTVTFVTTGSDAPDSGIWQITLGPADPPPKIATNASAAGWTVNGDGADVPFGITLTAPSGAAVSTDYEVAFYFPGTGGNYSQTFDMLPAPVDATAPAPSSASVNGSAFMLNWTESANPPVVQNSGHGSSQGLTIAATGGAATLSSVSTAGTVTTGTLSRSIAYGETVTLSAAASSFADSAPTPNNAAAFSTFPVANLATKPILPSHPIPQGETRTYEGDGFDSPEFTLVGEPSWDVLFTDTQGGSQVLASNFEPNGWLVTCEDGLNISIHVPPGTAISKGYTARWNPGT